MTKQKTVFLFLLSSPTRPRMTPPPSLPVSTKTLSSPYVDGWREIRIETRPLLLDALSAVRGRPPSLEAVLADMTQERDRAPALSLLSARYSASDDASLDLLPLPLLGGVRLAAVVAPSPVADAPPGSAGKLSSRRRGGVFLNRDNLILPEPPPSARRLLLLLRVSSGDDRGCPLLLLLLLPLVAALAWLPRMLPPFLELESTLPLPLRLLLR